MTVKYQVSNRGEGQGEVHALEGDQLVLSGEGAYAPGAPLILEVRHAEETRSIEGKSLGSKRGTEGTFHLRVRIHNIRREDRAWLQQILRP